jgi:mono/diheme cytochrome c family protein
MRDFVFLRLVSAVLSSSTVLLVACSGEQPRTNASDTPVPTVAATPADAGPVGAKTYEQICQSCHQATGLGVDGTFPPLKESPWLLGDPNVPIAIVIAGLQGEIKVNGTTYNGAMQPWGMLSDDDIADVLTYARSQWGNSASAVTATQVKAVRDKIGSRAAFTVAELQAMYPGSGK